RLSVAPAQHLYFLVSFTCSATAPSAQHMLTSTFQRRGDNSALFDRCQDRRTLVLNEDDEKLRRVCLAGVGTDNVNVVRTFIEGLTRVKGDRLLPLNLHYDGAFQHINECVRVMAMDGVHCARRILDDQHRALLTGEVG